MFLGAVSQISLQKFVHDLETKVVCDLEKKAVLGLAGGIQIT